MHMLYYLSLIYQMVSMNQPLKRLSFFHPFFSVLADTCSQYVLSFLRVLVTKIEDVPHVVNNLQNVLDIMVMLTWNCLYFMLAISKQPLQYYNVYVRYGLSFAHICKI